MDFIYIISFLVQVSQFFLDKKENYSFYKFKLKFIKLFNDQKIKISSLNFLLVVESIGRILAIIFNTIIPNKLLNYYT